MVHGKSTTINMMTGGTSITNGRILLNGVDITKEPVKAKWTFGLVPDNPDQFLKFKVLEFFNFVTDIYEVSKEERNKRIEELSKKFEIEKYLNDQIEDLSHGTKQKVMVIGVLLHNPSIWILDEPMTGLDPNAAYILKEMMKEHAKNGNTVFFSTHVLEVAEKLCDEIVIIKEGEVIYQGSYNTLVNKYKDAKSLEELFLVLLKDEKGN